MQITTNKEDGHHYMNDLNVIISNSYSRGIGDSLGRTARGLIAYEDSKDDLINGLLSYFTFAKSSPEHGYKWYAARYPVGEKYALVGNSRDHIIVAIATLKYLGHPFADEFIKGRAKRPRIMKAYTPGQKLWFKAIYSKVASFFYLVGKVLWLRPIQAIKWVTRLFGGNGDKLLPTYAIFYSAWASHVVKSEWVKKRLFKIYKGHAESTNYVLRMLCGQTFTDEEVYSYIPTRKNRWSTRLDGESDRDLTQYPEDKPEWNLELALLYQLHENQKMYGADQALGQKI